MGSRRKVSRVSQRERMHFSRSSEVLYFHTDVVSVHTDVILISGGTLLPYGRYIQNIRQADKRSLRCIVAGMPDVAPSPKAKLSFL